MKGLKIKFHYLIPAPPLSSCTSYYEDYLDNNPKSELWQRPGSTGVKINGAEVVRISGLGLLGVQGERLRRLLWMRGEWLTSQVKRAPYGTHNPCLWVLRLEIPRGQEGESMQGWDWSLVACFAQLHECPPAATWLFSS